MERNEYHGGTTQEYREDITSKLQKLMNSQNFVNSFGKLGPLCQFDCKYRLATYIDIVMTTPTSYQEIVVYTFKVDLKLD